MPPGPTPIMLAQVKTEDQATKAGDLRDEGARVSESKAAGTQPKVR